MNLFLKALPYLLIISLGFAIYFGFRHYESKISQLTTDYTCVVNENNSLKEENKSLKEQNKIIVEQLENIQKQIYESVTYVSDTSNKIDSLKLDEFDPASFVQTEAFQHLLNSVKVIPAQKTAE